MGTNVFVRPTPVETNRMRSASRQVCYVLSGLLPLACALLWIWKDDGRWGGTGLVAFIAMVFLASFLGPKADQE